MQNRVGKSFRAIPTTVALVALCVALGGSAIGAPALHMASSLSQKVTRAVKLARNADTTARKALKVARAAQTKAETALAKTAVPGPAGTPGAQGARGPTGAQGPQGEPGSARGYATVEWCSSGNCPDQHTIDWFTPDQEALGVDNQDNFKHAAAGVFCFKRLPFHVHSAVANLGPSSGIPTTNLYIVQTAVGTTADPIDPQCSPDGVADQNAVVMVRKISDGMLADPDISAKLLVLFN